jgi:glutamine cyclotransferase
LFVDVDPSNTVKEAVETDNSGSSAQPTEEGPWVYPVIRPVPDTVVAVLGQAAPATVWVVEPASGATLEVHQVEPGTLVVLVAAVLDGAASLSLDQFVVLATSPVVVSVNHEILEPNYGGDTFHPALDGRRVGRDFLLYVPTVTPNNRLVVVANEDAAVVLRDAAGGWLDAAELSVGQWWEPQGLSSGQVLRLESTGDVLAQSCAVTGASAVPPVDRECCAAGDVGRRFRFSTRERGPGGGAVAVMAYDDAQVELRNAAGEVLWAAAVAAGEVAFASGLGEQRALELEASGDVAVMAGDMSAPGADTIDWMGEDLTVWRGAGGTSFVVHSQAQVVGDTTILAGALPVALRVNGAASVLPAYGALPLADGQVYSVLTSSPVLIAAQGGGDRYFDMGTVVPAVPRASSAPRGVLHAVTLSPAGCTGAVKAMATLCNAGGAALVAGGEVQLVRATAASNAGGPLAVVQLWTLPKPLPSGFCTAVALEVASAGATSPSDPVAWALRWQPADAADQVVVATGGGPLTAAPCGNGAPVFVSVPPASLVASTDLAYVAQAVDPEGQPVTYTLLGGPAGAALEPATGLLTWTPPASAVEKSASFVILAADPQGETAAQAFSLSLPPTPPCSGSADADGDGACPPLDCAPGDPSVGPAVVEVLGDGIDNDCSPLTPDALPLGAVQLEVAPEASQVPPGAQTRLLWLVRHTGANVVPAGLDVVLTVSCGALAPSQLQADVAGIAPGGFAAGTSSFEVPAGAGGNTCEVSGEVMAGTVSLASASASFAVVSAATGSISAEPSAVLRGADARLSFSVGNAPPEAAVVVRAGARVLATTTAAATPQTVAVDTSGFEPAAHPVALEVDGTEVARTVLQVGLPTRLEIARGVGEAGEWWQGAASSTIEFRPLGPLPGAPAVGSRLFGYWEASHVQLGIEPADPSADPTDRLRVELLGADEVFIVMNWERAGGSSTSHPEVATSVDTLGELIEITVPASLLPPLEQGAELRLRVTLVDAGTPIEGQLGTVRDVRQWATRAEAEPVVDAFGTLVLGPSDNGEPGDSDASTGESDATSDAGSPEGGGGSGGEATNDGLVGDDDASGDPASSEGSGEGGCGGCHTGPGGGSALGHLGLAALVLGAWWQLRAARRRRLPRRWLTLLLVLGGWGCGSDDAGSSSGSAADAQGGAESAEDGGTSGLSDTQGGAGGEDGDGGDGESSSDADGGSAQPTDAGPADADTADPDGGSPGAGAPLGAACDVAADCASGICLPGAAVGTCSVSCELYVCPDGWGCSTFPGGGKACVPAKTCLDADKDGFGVGRACAGGDCDDSDASVAPNKGELCNGKDDDCDGEIDEGVANACGGCGALPPEVCNGFDDDCDGAVDEGVTNACGGCGPAGSEVCNGFDDDCDGTIDLGVCGVCAPGEQEPCFAGMPEQAGVGPCVVGVRTCEDGVFGACVGSGIPSGEVCNGQDDNCDGSTDEGVSNACGGCGPTQTEVCNGLDDDCDGATDEGVTSPCGACTPCGQALIFPAEAGVVSPTLSVAPDGAVTLGAGQVKRNFIWVPNSAENSVSRWSTVTGREEGRFYVGLDPSRTAIDLDGNAWVGHRGDGKLTRLISRPEDCIDRNGDGVIQTSRDLNGDGRITFGEVVNTLADPLADECVQCQVQVGPGNDLVRGVAVDDDNFVWAGTWNSQKIVKIDPDTCEIVLEVPTSFEGPPLSIYGLAIDGAGSLWTSTFSDPCILRIDTDLGVAVQRVCANVGYRYGLAVDGKNHVWFANWGSAVMRYRPEADAWDFFDSPEQLAESTGVVVGIDGSVFVAAYANHRIARLAPESGTWTFWDTAQNWADQGPQYNPRGVTIDEDGDIWAICRGSSSLVEFSAVGEPKGAYPIRSATNPNAGTGPYSYSDNTGFQLFTFTATEGSWSVVFDAEQPVDYVALEYSAHQPVGTSVAVQLRYAMPGEALQLAEYSPESVENPLLLAGLVPPGAQRVEARFWLRTSEPTTKPVLRDVRFLFETPPCIGQDAVACPSGQQCEQVFGGCVVQPVDCAQDFACDAAEFCNAQGKCQQGCRTSPDNCGVGATCDASSRLCKQKAGECATDSGCAAGSYCSAVGTCEPGCRTEPDSCPPAFSCDAQSRACAPLPPECSTDAECPPSAYCAAAGKCLLGCRLGEGGCPDGLVCSALLRTCGAAPQGCTPGAPKPEACNGGDDDCNGVIDDGTALMGETCAHGALAGVRACWNGRPVCKLEPVPGPGAPTLEGPLEDLWLHGGAYAVVGTLGMRGTVVLDAGVTLTGLQDGAAAVVSEAAHDLVWAEDATLERMSIAVAGEAHASLLGVEVLGRSGGNNFAECGGAATCALFGCTVRDAELRSSAAAELTVEYSKLISDDTAFRHLMVATGARTTVRFVEGQGRNALPRPHMGAYVAGAFEMQGSSFGTLQIGARVLTTADVVLTDSAFVSCDAGVQVEGASRPVLIAVHIDDTDPGHPGIGVRFEGLSEVGGAVVNGLSFATDSLDRPLWLDPDNFRPNGISTWQGLDFGGHPEATRARLSGAAVGGALTFDSIVGVNRFELADWVSLWGVQAVVEPGLTFASRLPDQADFRLHAGAGTKLQFLPSATLDHVGCQVDAGAEVQAEGLACRYALGPERRCFDISGVLELKDCTLQSEVLPTGPERRFVGVEARAGSAVSVVDTAFERLRAGVFLHGGAEVSVLGSHFESVQRPLWAIGVSTLGPIEAVTITDADPLLASVGVTLQFEPPGVAELVSVAFDLGAEDVALAVDPDVFAKSSPSSFGALTQSNGAPVRPALFGVAEASALELQSATPLELLLLDTVDFRFGGATKVGPNITLFAPDGVSRLLRVLDPGTTLELSPGATLRNLWLQIDAASTLHADGATFESTDGLGRDMLRVWGTAELANCAFVGTNRVHNAAIADAGGSLSLESCTFVGCNHAILAANLGSVTAQGCSIAASQRPLSVGQSGKLVCNQTTIADDSPVHGVPCIETWDPRAGMVLDVANTHFEVGADDAPFQFHYAAFRQDATVQVKGSTFENDFQGLGYLLWGEIWENIGINLAHVELAQPDFRVNGTLFSRFASTVSIAPGTRLRALDEAPIAVRAIDTSAMHIDGVEFRNVVPYWEGASQGSLTNSLVESGYTWFLSLSYVTTPGAVTMTGNTFRRSAPAADKLGGVRVEGGPEVAPALIGNSFQNLLVGVQKAGAPSPVLSGNTFEGCVTDVSEP